MGCEGDFGNNRLGLSGLEGKSCRLVDGHAQSIIEQRRVKMEYPAPKTADLLQVVLLMLFG